MLNMARVAAAVAALVSSFAVLGAAAGCAAPDHTYVANPANKTYFRVPASWHEIDEKALQRAANGPSPTPGVDTTWVVAYDAAVPPSMTHLVANQTPVPIVYVSVRPVPTSPNGELSLDDLRDLVLPVTAAARAAAGSSTNFSNFRLVSDSVLTLPSGQRGVHEIFQYRVAGGPSQTFDETAYANKEGSKVYLMFLRCSTACYQARHAELEDVTASFTVQDRS